MAPSSPRSKTVPAPRVQRGALRIRWLLLVVVIATPLYPWVIQPWLQRAADLDANGRARALMLDILRAEAALRTAVTIDQDGDGAGEFGYLRELTGEWSGRLKGPAPARSLKLPPDASWAALPDGEVLQTGGYCFRVYLPRRNATASADPLAPPRATTGDADEQETRFAAYCWPARAIQQGSSLFGSQQMNPDFCCGGLARRASAASDYLGLATVPAAGAALTPGAGEDAARLQGQLVIGLPAADGALWMTPG